LNAVNYRYLNVNKLPLVIGHLSHPEKCTGHHVIPVQSTPQDTSKTHSNPSPSLTACGLRPYSPPKNNCSTFADSFGGGFCVPLKQNSQISGAASRSSREGISASDFGQHAPADRAEGDLRPFEKPLLTLSLTAEQLKHLAFAVYCQVSELEDSHEADDLEVREAMERLNEVSQRCIELEKAELGSAGRQRSGRTSGTDGAQKAAIGSCAAGEAESTGVPLAIGVGRIS
jgi:hypothetical protein